MNKSFRPFLTAEWKHLAMMNYEICPSALARYVPAGTELDTWDGKTFVSVVGFQFLHTRVYGLAIPWHCNFEEVNLRFYVRRPAEDGWRRGVVFVKEIVPRAAIACVARRLYNEPYVALPMAHRVESGAGGVDSYTYSWHFGGRQNFLQLVVRGAAEPLPAGSEAEFITEHYWGYNSQRYGSTMEYRVEHPRWRVWAAESARLDCDVVGLYGDEFQSGLSGAPSSAFLAEGSPVTVSPGIRLRA